MKFDLLGRTAVATPRSVRVAAVCAVMCLAGACADEPGREDGLEEEVLEAASIALALDPPPVNCGPQTDSFYKGDAGSLNVPNGTVLKCEALSAPDAALAGYRVLYKTTAVTRTGNVPSEIPLAASGTVWIPGGEIEKNDAGVPIRPNRPVVANTHGAVGVIPICGPSRTAGWDSKKVTALSAGLPIKPVTVVPDYVGLGFDPGLRVAEKDYVIKWPNGAQSSPFSHISHPMVSLEGEGRATVDLVRAAKQLPNAKLTGAPIKWLTFGQSQGGHAAIATAEVVKRGYGAEMNLRGVVAGAPATELDKNQWWEKDVRNSLFGMITASLPLEFRDLRASTFLTPDGAKVVGQFTNGGCFNNDTLLQTLAAYNSVDLFRGDPFTNPTVLTALDANSPGRKAADVKMFVGTVHGDPLVSRYRTTSFVNKASYRENITFCEYYGGTCKSKFEQDIYNNLHWSARSFDHDAFSKMFGGSEFRMRCTQGGTESGTAVPADKQTPVGFVKTLGF